jgi:hypothetical protein
MKSKLKWDDLLIQRFPEEKIRGWLGCWNGSVSGRVAPIAMSKFGDWFLRREDGSTHELSVLEGTYEKIASSPQEFAALLNQQSWQEQHLLSLLVFSLHEKGVIPKAGECYAFAPHPTLTGKVDLEHVMVMEIGVWQHICSQTLSGQLESKQPNQMPEPTAAAGLSSS